MQFLTEIAWFLIVRKMSGKTVCSANPEIMVLFGLSKKFTFWFIDFKQKIGYNTKHKNQDFQQFTWYDYVDRILNIHKTVCQKGKLFCRYQGGLAV